MSNKLKPCPFCGGEAVVLKKYGAMYVKCQKCFAKSGPVYDNIGYSATEHAVELWNNRVNCPECIKEE